MWDRLRRFMAGRYGYDHLSRMLNIVCLACILVAMIFRMFGGKYVYAVLYSAALLLLVWVLYRALSRNRTKRLAENQKYLKFQNAFFTKLKQWKAKWKNRKIYKYCKCPSCRLPLRVPRGKGEIKIKCPRCSAEFNMRS